MGWCFMLVERLISGCYSFLSAALLCCAAQILLPSLASLGKMLHASVVVLHRHNALVMQGLLLENMSLKSE
jgi:hypothetical protein